jgi:hypothetical protein
MGGRVNGIPGRVERQFRDDAAKAVQPNRFPASALPIPPPRLPFDIETMEPLDVPSQWGWSDDNEPPPADWWLSATPDPRWQAPEFDFCEGSTLNLEAADPFAPDDAPVFRWD